MGCTRATPAGISRRTSDTGAPAQPAGSPPGPPPPGAHPPRPAPPRPALPPPSRTSWLGVASAPQRQCSPVPSTRRSHRNAAYGRSQWRAEAKKAPKGSPAMSASPKRSNTARAMRSLACARDARLACKVGGWVGDRLAGWRVGAELPRLAARHARLRARPQHATGRSSQQKNAHLHGGLVIHLAAVQRPPRRLNLRRYVGRHLVCGEGQPAGAAGREGDSAGARSRRAARGFGRGVAHPRLHPTPEPLKPHPPAPAGGRGAQACAAAAPTIPGAARGAGCSPASACRRR